MLSTFENLKIFFQWTLRVVFLSLLQLWTALVFSTFSHDVPAPEVLRHGALIFFANSVAIRVREDYRRIRGQRKSNEKKTFEETMCEDVIPGLVLWASITLFCALLTYHGQSIPIKLQLVQVGVVILALFYSALHFYQISSILRDANEAEIET